MLNPPTVKFNYLSCQIIISVCEFIYKFRYFPRASESSGRNFVYYHMHFFSIKKLFHIGIYYSTGYCYYLYVAWGKFFGESHCKGIDAAFCCRIGNFSGSSSHPPHRRNIYDTSILIMYHVFNYFFSNIKYRI